MKDIAQRLIWIVIGVSLLNTIMILETWWGALGIIPIMIGIRRKSLFQELLTWKRHQRKRITRVPND